MKYGRCSPHRFSTKPLRAERCPWIAILNTGKPKTRVLSDGWTVVTKDRPLSAQREHTVAVIEDGVEVLTQVPSDVNGSWLV
jgi:methionine aminopeptidase